MPEPRPPGIRNAAARIRSALSGAGVVLSVRDLVAITGLHENAVRRNLKELIQSGEIHVQRPPAGRSVRGRPTLRYILMPSREAPYGEILPLLVALLSGADVSGEDAFRVGRAHGSRSSGRGDARQAVLASLSDLGFAPIEEPPTGSGGDVVENIRLSRCPFAEVVQSPAASERLCALHHGILVGVAEAHGGHLESFEIVNPLTDSCRVRLRVNR